MMQRVYTVEEVNRMLPLVAAIVEEARDAVLEGARAAWAFAEDMPEKALARLADLRRCTRELEALGGFLREPAAGTVEWFGMLDGEIVFLSWRPGEGGVGFWRTLYGRPADRRPLREAALPAARA